MDATVHIKTTHLADIRSFFSMSSKAVTATTAMSMKLADNSSRTTDNVLAPHSFYLYAITGDFKKQIVKRNVETLTPFSFPISFQITNFMAYETERFNATFTRALQ